MRVNYNRGGINIGGIQPYPYRGDIGGALKREIHRSRSSYPLKNYMRERLEALSKAAGYSSYISYEMSKKR